jgi:hypothetical protein
MMALIGSFEKAEKLGYQNRAVFKLFRVCETATVYTENSDLDSYDGSG